MRRNFDIRRFFTVHFVVYVHFSSFDKATSCLRSCRHISTRVLLSFSASFNSRTTQPVIKQLPACDLQSRMTSSTTLHACSLISDGNVGILTCPKIRSLCITDICRRHFHFTPVRSQEKEFLTGDLYERSNHLEYEKTITTFSCLLCPTLYMINGMDSTFRSSKSIGGQFET